MKSSAGVRFVWQLAADEAASHDFSEIEPGHLLIGLCLLADPRPGLLLRVEATKLDAVLAEGKVLKASLLRTRLDPKRLRRRVRHLLGRRDAGQDGLSGTRVLHRSTASRQIFDAATETARRENSEQRLWCRHLLGALLDSTDPSIRQALAEMRGDPSPPRDSVEAEPAEDDRKPGTPHLDQLGRDLTALAREGRLEPVIGRRAEMRALARALSQQRKRSAILVGEPGVGKTGIVEGLARLVASDAPPPALAGARIVELSVAALTAGTKYRGELEERVRAVLDEAGSNHDVILFLDEIHTVVRTGGGGSALDVATILKPALARGEVRCIGATTTAEYRRYIEDDAALQRRFQVIWVEEPSPDETMVILSQLRARFVDHHNVDITDDALRSAVDLSQRYLHDQRLPDKAIDLIDQACARATLPTLTPGRDVSARPEVTGDHVAEVLAERTGIPVQRLTRSDTDRLRDMERALGTHVVGQHQAISTVSATIRAARVGLRDPRRPVGVFLFAGPSGTGKTELAKAMAEVLFDDETRLIRIDMSEYQERHAVSRLVGAPPGYLGHDRDGQLTGPVRTHPYSVVLFDEIEKAHPEILDVLLQLLDEGQLTDARGRRASFRECVIVMTTNLGNTTPDPTDADADRRDRVRAAVRAALRPELLGRIGGPIVFDPLTPAQLRAVVGKLLGRLRGQLTHRGIRLEITDRAVEKLLRDSHHTTHGARELEHLVEQLIAHPVATALLDVGLGTSGEIAIDVIDDDIKLAFIATSSGDASPEA